MPSSINNAEDIQKLISPKLYKEYFALADMDDKFAIQAG